VGIVSYYFGGRTEALLLMQITEKQTILCQPCSWTQPEVNFKEGLKGSRSSDIEESIWACAFNTHPSLQRDTHDYSPAL